MTKKQGGVRRFLIRQFATNYDLKDLLTVAGPLRA
jgi:hypothetical protein